ncbi:TPA: hypothetical protein I9507_001788 [Legionella pneumophila]|uniref:hypothetical protein n=1 Tax=Legionella pneumophila TaxID=446 RepID=UPI0012B68294|nr:hypothetical protein [Legionella pneumophila]HAT4705792.1 hypothetical protein [Legionella pneumophila]HCE5519358.1 hypothetical protein [Legionella pneumophila]HCE6145800.1 hypothetical protein [Legionella pneumophila]
MTFYHLNVFWRFVFNPIIQLVWGENERPINPQYVLYYTNTGQYPKSWISAIAMWFYINMKDFEIRMPSFEFTDDIGGVGSGQDVSAYVALGWVGAYPSQSLSLNGVYVFKSAFKPSIAGKIGIHKHQINVSQWLRV